MVAKFWKSLEILSSFFFRFLKLDFWGVWDRNLPPPKKKHLTWNGCMINDISIFHSNSFMPSPKQKKNGKGSNFPMLSLPRSRRAAIVDKISNHGKKLRVASLVAFRMPLSKSENDTYGIWTNYFLWRMWSIFGSFACFRAKDRPAFFLILRNLLPCAAEQETFWH